MTYIDAYHDKKHNKIRVVERNNGNRQFIDITPEYVFYYEDPKGKYTSIYGDRISKFKCNDDQKFRRELAMMRGKKIFESDTNIIFKTLAEHYKDSPVPEPNLGLFDIEVNFDPKRGFASPEDAYAEVNAISLWRSHEDTLYTLALAPPTITEEQAHVISAKFENTYICENEEELLKTFLDLIEDIDIISGWNSSFFDIPYMIKRIELILGSDWARKLCLWNQKPIQRWVNKFGKEQITYDLVGKVHLDYLELFQKHYPQELHTYKLDYVGEMEVGVKKVEYEGSLYDLYHYDFEKFIDYNRVDVDILIRIHNKNDYIGLAVTVAHTNSVLLKTTLGTVQLVEQAVLNESHDRNLIVHDRKKQQEEHHTAAGAYVANPKVGIHEEIGAIDINSLYPSCIRALNMCVETIVGQFRPDATNKFLSDRIDKGMTGTDAWHDVFGSFEYQSIMEHTSDILTVDFEDGSTDSMTAHEWYERIFMGPEKWILSANGTIFRSDVEGIIPGILTKWYRERKEMQSEKKKFSKLAHNETDPEKKKEYQEKTKFWDQRQFVRKILLNSLYGALLNPSFRMYDPRVGQSVTLTGRCINKFMGAKTNQIITGKFDHQGEAIIYGDTDSCAADTVIDSNLGNRTVEELFNNCNTFWQSGNKEYATDENLTVASYNTEKGDVYQGNINYIYRHKVSKPQFEIEDEHGNIVRVTEDHSIMVEKNGIITSIKPKDLKKNDIIISIN